MTDTKENKEEISEETIRHSAAHIMAEAVLSLFPDAKFGIGPSIENGFYYDFELSRPLTPEDLPVIEDKMKEIVKSNSPFIWEELPKKEANQLFKNQPYKQELLEDIDEDKVTVY
jgi:threonyl-tRNA synthetase